MGESQSRQGRELEQDDGRRGASTTVRFLCSECHHTFESTTPVGYKCNQRIVCDECKRKEHKVTCKTCRESFTVYTNHKNVNCSKCAKINRKQIKKGELCLFQSTRDGVETSFLCPSGIVKKSDRLNAFVCAMISEQNAALEGNSNGANSESHDEIAVPSEQNNAEESLDNEEARARDPPYDNVNIQ